MNVKCVEGGCLEWRKRVSEDMLQTIRNAMRCIEVQTTRGRVHDYNQQAQQRGLLVEVIVGWVLARLVHFTCVWMMMTMMATMPHTLLCRTELTYFSFFLSLSPSSDEHFFFLSFPFFCVVLALTFHCFVMVCGVFEERLFFLKKQWCLRCTFSASNRF